jgi:hypothetical protein
MRASVLAASSGDISISPEWDSEVRREQTMDAFACFLQFSAFVAVVVSLLCIWEFSIGIKKSIKKLFKG